jgi:cytochrome c biogenesis protein CcdA
VSALLALGTALVLGFVHALEIDHMAAVTAFVSRGPALQRAAGFGARWGLGHSLAVLGAGAVLLATGLHWSPGVGTILEGAVGVALVGVGAWSLRAARNLHLHPPAEHGDHAHLHLHKGAPPERHHAHPNPEAEPPSHPHPHDHTHQRAAQGITAVGFLHGLAGTSAVVALVPVTLLRPAGLGLAYLVAFGVGVTAGMALFALIAAAAMRQAAERSVRWGKRVTGAAGVASIAVGAWWLVEVALQG